MLRRPLDSLLRVLPCGSAAIAALTLVLSAVPERGLASDAPREDPRQAFFGVTPSFAIGLGFYTTEVDGSVSAVDGMGSPIRPPDSGSASALTPLLQFSLGLESRPLEFIPGGPSVFAQGDYFATLSLERNAASEGGGQGFRPPDSANFPEAAIGGQGSKSIVQTDTSALGVTAGLSFPVDLGDLTLRLKPGVAWTLYTWDLQGRVLRAVKPSDTGTDFRAVRLTNQHSFDAQGVGPYLGIELEPEPFGPLLAAFYIEGAAYRVLSDTRKRMRATESFDDAFGMENYAATWGFEFDDWTWRASLGVRLYLRH